MPPTHTFSQGPYEKAFDDLNCLRFYWLTDEHEITMPWTRNTRWRYDRRSLRCASDATETEWAIKRPFDWLGDGEIGERSGDVNRRIQSMDAHRFDKKSSAYKRQRLLPIFIYTLEHREERTATPIWRETISPYPPSLGPCTGDVRSISSTVRKPLAKRRHQAPRAA